LHNNHTSIKNFNQTLTKLFLSFFLLLTIVSNVAVTAVQQMQGTVGCAFKECKNDDTNDCEEKETKSESETDIEKDFITYKVTSYIKREFYTSSFSKKRIHEYLKEAKSSLYSSLPYNPPEA
jgi:hypothetical protein